MRHPVAVVLISSVFLSGCAGSEVDDVGLASCGDVPVRQPCRPVGVRCELEDCGDVAVALEWWRERRPETPLRFDPQGDVVVQREPDLAVVGRARTDCNPMTGEVRGCVIALSNTASLLTIVHELGHCPFGLADDPLSNELDSIMASPAWVFGDVTLEDHARLDAACDS